MPSVTNTPLSTPKALLKRTYIAQCSVSSEVLDEIAACLLVRNSSFAAISAFSLASYQLRQIALRRYFARLAVRTPSHWLRCCTIPGVYEWTRVLIASSKTLSPCPAKLSNFANLQAVEIDFLHDGFLTQGTRIKLLFKYLPTYLKRLTLTALPRIDITLLSSVATCFPALHTLEMSCAGRLDQSCCWLCYEESLSCTVLAPIPDHYATVKGLSVAFGTALRPLQNLQHLVLGIFLSSEEMLYEHVDHREPFYSVHHPGDDDDVPLPCGPDDCALCQGFANEVREDELLAAASLALHLSHLETVTWSTFFAGAVDTGDSIDDRETTIWVRRAQGQVHVRRAPW